MRDKPRTVTAKTAVKILNRLLEKDRLAISTLFLNRTPCNAALGNDPETQVRSYGGKMFSISPIGVMQAFFGIRRKDKWGFIAAIANDECTLIERFDLAKSNETTLPDAGDGNTVPVVRDLARKRRRR